jgi:hypothetical protein
MPDLLDPAERTEAQRRISDRNARVELPIYPVDPADTRKCFPILDADVQNSLDEVCRNAAWPQAGASDTELPIWAQFCRLASLVSLFPSTTDPSVAAYTWSRGRCLLAGAGFAHHDALATILNTLYPVCDLTPGETHADWEKALEQAHTNCGWPAVLGRMPWRRMVSALPLVSTDDPPESWHLAAALLHLLKHARTRPQGIVVTYRGTAALIPPESGTNVPGYWTKRRESLLRALGCTTGTPRGTVHPLTKAMTIVLGRITLDKLLPQASLSDLPMSVLAGPWSSLDPDPSSSDSFIQAECRLSGVWAAAAGKIAAYSGEPVDAVGYQWNVMNPGDFIHAKEALAHSIPPTYPQTWPSDVLLTAFPNIMLDWATDKDAACALLELPLFASMLREANGPFGNEFPFVCFLPDQPTPDGSTNQGKTRAATVYVRAMAPGAPCIASQDTGSAPDSRATAEPILTHGTLALDEWSMPANKTNVLNHQNLQTLCTGGTVAAGRVLENGGALVLKHSLVASAKALDFPPDMVNRSFVWFLRDFTQAELSRADVKRATESGALSLQLRLATLSTCEKFDVGAKFAAAPYTSGLLRFDAHMVLARVLYELRTGRPESGQIDATIREMRARFARHTQEADASGVLAGLESGHMTKVRVSNLFAGMTPDVIEQVRVELNSLHGNTKTRIGNWNTPSQLLDTIRKARGFPSLQAMLPAVTGTRGRVTDRVIVMALGTDIRQVLPEGTIWSITDTPYGVERGTDQTGYLRIRIVPIPSASVDTAGPGIDAHAVQPPVL